MDTHSTESETFQKESPIGAKTHKAECESPNSSVTVHVLQINYRDIIRRPTWNVGEMRNSWTQHSSLAYGTVNDAWEGSISRELVPFHHI